MLKRKDIPKEKTYKYKGLSKEAKEDMLEALKKDFSFPARLLDGDLDHAMTLKTKSDERRRFKSAFDKQAKESVAAADADIAFCGFVFAKGEAVTVNFRSLTMADAKYVFTKCESLTGQEILVEVDPKKEKKAAASAEKKTYELPGAGVSQ